MTRLRIAVASTLLLPLTLAGCGDDDPQPRIPPSSASSPTTTTPSASPDAAVEPTLPPEAEGNDEAAAEAFVRYYWDLVNYAQKTGDVKRISKLAFPSCTGCDRAAGYYRDLYAKGGSQSGGEYTVNSVLATAVPLENGSTSFNATVDVSSTAFTDQETGTSPAVEHPAAATTASMTLGSGPDGFRVASLERSE